MHEIRLVEIKKNCESKAFNLGGESSGKGSSGRHNAIEVLQDLFDVDRIMFERLEDIFDRSITCNFEGISNSRILDGALGEWTSNLGERVSDKFKEAVFK